MLSIPHIILEAQRVTNWPKVTQLVRVNVQTHEEPRIPLVY